MFYYLKLGKDWFWIEAEFSTITWIHDIWKTRFFCIRKSFDKLKKLKLKTDHSLGQKLMSSSIIKSPLIASFLNTYQLVEQDRNLTMTILHIKPPNQNSYNPKHL